MLHHGGQGLVRDTFLKYNKITKSFLTKTVVEWNNIPFSAVFCTIIKKKTGILLIRQKTSPNQKTYYVKLFEMDNEIQIRRLRDKKKNWIICLINYFDFDVIKIE